MTRLAIALACSAVIACAGRPSSDPNVTRAFGNPERVTIVGYEDDAMEPFITRDGRYLLFTNVNEPSVNTDLHFRIGSRRQRDSSRARRFPQTSAHSTTRVRTVRASSSIV